MAYKIPFKKTALVHDKRNNENIKFVWTKKGKFKISEKALKKAEKENKIDIIYIE